MAARSVRRRRVRYVEIAEIETGPAGFGFHGCGVLRFRDYSGRGGLAALFDLFLLVAAIKHGADHAGGLGKGAVSGVHGEAGRAPFGAAIPARKHDYDR